MTSTLVINVSNYVSPYCYSLLRAEPYTSCDFRCWYCYSRWYWRTLSVNVNNFAIALVKKFIRSIIRKGLKPIPLRLSTLSDPFHSLEVKAKASLAILKECLKHEYPVIINTKGVLYIRKPWYDVVKKLLDRSLAILQVSITTINDSVSKLLEVNAPSPSERLKALRDISSTDLPMVIRLSPFIPYVSTYPSIKELTSLFKDLNIKHVIVEGLRLELNNISKLLKILKPEIKVDLQPYSSVSNSGVVKISLKSLLHEYITLYRELMNVGITFATCKEGLYSIHTSPDCCGIYLINNSNNVALRPTLYEIYNYVKTYGPIDLNKLDEIFYKVICVNYLCGDTLTQYPRMVSKILRNHERKLIKVLKDSALLHRICPVLKLRDNLIIVNDITCNS